MTTDDERLKALEETLHATLSGNLGLNKEDVSRIVDMIMREIEELKKEEEAFNQAVANSLETFRQERKKADEVAKQIKTPPPPSNGMNILVQGTSVRVHHRPSPGDGVCFLHSLQRALANIGVKVTMEELLAMLGSGYTIEHWKANWNKIDDTLFGEVIRQVSARHQVSVVIFFHMTGRAVEMTDNGGTQRRIYLFYTGGHYDWLQPV